MENTFDRQSEDAIEGRNPVLEALSSGRTINKLFIASGEKDSSVKKIIAIAKEKDLVFQFVDKMKLDKMSVTRNHQGVIAIASVKEYVDVDDIINIASEKNEPPFIVILDEITDVQNLGSILRTADAVGVHGIIIPKRRAAGLNAAVSRISAGAVEYVPVARVTNIARTLEYLKEKNIWIAGTDVNEGSPFYETDLRGPLAIVIGSEGQGMGRLVREKCDFLMNIPMKGRISSLNAAVAAAVILYEAFRKRI